MIVRDDWSDFVAARSWNSMTCSHWTKQYTSWGVERRLLLGNSFLLGQSQRSAVIAIILDLSWLHFCGPCDWQYRHWPTPPHRNWPPAVFGPCLATISNITDSSIINIIQFWLSSSGLSSLATSLLISHRTFYFRHILLHDLLESDDVDVIHDDLSLFLHYSKGRWAYSLNVFNEELVFIRGRDPEKVS